MLETEFHFQLMRCFQLMNNQVARQAATHDLLPGQSKILEYLYESDGGLAKEISRACVIDESTVTSLLKRMMNQQLIYREVRPTDRRSSSIYLTKLGREKAEQVKRITAQTNRLALKHLSVSEQELLLKNMRQIIANFSQLNQN
ncbi:MarR family winged helix-turn-helix transcriptional regulator [Atopobacter phocae]|uniref:MarR family winged helix-turn-helix transcriptional regulator n=1 Tax=Atopobacter phocae TaxID=136492 RepID=UPI00046E9F52|nr:MarR family winged helix-turn-helix transcriptional regulator [Atopobacter phocae]